MPFAKSNLPAITKFLKGLVSFRNPTDAPISRIPGLGTIIHYDALIDGLNTEVSPIDSMQRRPGWVSFSTNQSVDTFQYKDLNGAISLFQDTGLTLKLGATTVFTYSGGATYPISLEGRGNFVYATNGVDRKRINNNALTTTIPWGQSTPSIPLQITQQSLTVFNAVTGFTSGNLGGSPNPQDTIGGLFTVEDSANDRVLTVTINPGVVHFNVTYSGNQISINSGYTEVNDTTQTGTGSGLNITTAASSVITIVNNYTASVTGTGISNGVCNYYPNTGLSTIDFDMAYSAPMTISLLSALVNGAQAASIGTSTPAIPTSATEFLYVFANTSVVEGLYTNPGQSPVGTQAGVALNITVTPSLPIDVITINSGLYDVTNPQLSLEANVGIAPRLYQYVTPEVNITDTFTGTVQLQVVDFNTNPLLTFTFTNKTLAQIAVSLESSHWQPIYVQNGTTAYMVLRNFESTATSPGTVDAILCINENTLVDLADTNLNFQNWVFLSSNDYPQLPQQGVQITYAVRDINSGGLSNVAPSVTVGPQLFPTRWSAQLVLPGPIYDPATPAPENGYQNIELYRTVDGGSSFLFEQLIGYQNLELYSTDFSITDEGLNDALIGPIDEENDPPPVGLTQITSHTGRLFGIVANRVYFSGGPDTTNGNGDESWPPGNNFQFPGLVTDIKSTEAGLIVGLTDDLHVISGVDSSSYYAKPWLAGFGLSTHTAWDKDGSTLFVYTTKQQLHAISTSREEGVGSFEIGFDIGDTLAEFFTPQATSLTFHRSTSNDTALYLSNGSTRIARYDTGKKAWSPLAQTAGSMTSGRVKSLETSTGVQTLLNSTNGGVWARSLTTFADNGVPYPAFFTVGVIQLAPPGQVAMLNNVAMQAVAVGTIPQVWLLFNEINDSLVPFTRLMNPVDDPPDAPGSQSLLQKRWYTESTLAPFPTGQRLINLASIKVVFSATDTVKNEVYALFLRDSI
jgi:hypothetical protein